jgi:hypothetical protein
MNDPPQYRIKKSNFVPVRWDDSPLSHNRKDDRLLYSKKRDERPLYSKTKDEKDDLGRDD